MRNGNIMRVFVWAGAMVAAGCVSVFGIDTKGWEASLNAGLNLTRGNKDTLLANGGIAAFRSFGQNEIRLGLDGAYGKTEEEQTVGNAKAAANYKRKLAHAYGYVDASVLEDTIADIDYRAMIGPGVGYYVLDNSRAKLGLEAGVSYVYERVAGVQDDYVACRFAERLDVKLSDTAKCWEAVEYLPAIEDFQQYLLNAEAGIEAAINAHLSLRVVVQDAYNSRPGADREYNDLILTAGVSYRL
jgi:putative salt-induced outer membrane protein YdiY